MNIYMIILIIRGFSCIALVTRSRGAQDRQRFLASSQLQQDSVLGTGEVE